MVAIDLPLAAIGGEVAVMASGVGDVDGPVRVEVPLTGASVLPPAPVHLRIDPSGNMLRWARRSRAGWRWIDGSDAPLGEEREAYRLTIADADGTRTVETEAPSVALASGTATISVAQLGTNGVSPPTRLG